MDSEFPIWKQSGASSCKSLVGKNIMNRRFYNSMFSNSVCCLARNFLPVRREIILRTLAANKQHPKVSNATTHSTFAQSDSESCESLFVLAERKVVLSHQVAKSRGECDVLFSQIPTLRHTYIHPSIHPSIHACMHACMHACTHTSCLVDFLAQGLNVSSFNMMFGTSLSHALPSKHLAAVSSSTNQQMRFRLCLKPGAHE